MPIRPIVRLGHPTLRSVAQALPAGRIDELAIQELIDDMIETMRAAHGVGLAAPQLGTSLQVFVYEMAPPMASPPADVQDAPAAGAETRGPTEEPVREPARESVREASGPIPLHVVINPMLTPLAGELVYDWEGCLSIPDLRGLVPRHPAVRVRGLDRLRDLKGLAFRDEWERYMAAGAAEPPDPFDPHPRSSPSQAVQPEEPVLASAHPG